MAPARYIHRPRLHKRWASSGGANQRELLFLLFCAALSCLAGCSEPFDLWEIADGGFLQSRAMQILAKSQYVKREMRNRGTYHRVCAFVTAHSNAAAFLPVLVAGRRFIRAQASLMRSSTVSARKRVSKVAHSYFLVLPQPPANRACCVWEYAFALHAPVNHVSRQDRNSIEGRYY